MATDPCLWIDADRNQQEMDQNAPRRARKVADASTRTAAVYERHPQFCSLGDEPDKPGTSRRDYQRFVHVVRHDGHIVFATLTNASAHLDVNTGYAANQRNKHRHLGWFRFGQCPLAAAMAGELKPHLIVSYAIADLVEKNHPPCQPKRDARGAAIPCEHATIEIEARRKAHNAKAFKAEAAELKEADKAMIALAESSVASGKDTASLVSSLSALIEKLVGQGKPADANKAPKG